MRAATLAMMMMTASTLASAAPALAAPAPMTPRPVDAFIGDILADAPDAATLNRRCDAYVAEIDKRIAALEGERGAATIDGTLQQYDDLNLLLSSAGSEFSLYRETMPDDARRTAGGACEVRIGVENNKINLSRPIYDRLKAIDATAADAPTKLYLSRTLATFERAGVALPPAERAKVLAMQDKLAALGTQFDSNIAAGRATIEADSAELAGLPADFIVAHKPGTNGKVTLATDYTDFQPVMTYATSEALRKRLFTVYMNRAYPANDAVLRDMLNTRQQLATALRRKDYATLVLEDKMLNTPAKVQALLTEMAGVAKPAGERDLAKKLAVQAAMTGTGAASVPATLTLWNNAYVTNQVKKRQYAYDSQEARKYFAYDNVRDGILKLTQDMFGVEIRPWQTAKWTPLAEAYEVYDQGKLIGRFYFDNHPRPGKYEHANQIGLRPGLTGRIVPMGALVMNLPAGDHTTGLMEHRDVETFLHEFGHLLHHTFGGQQQRWAGLSGVSTEWDFVEAPSQMLEEWVYDYDTLKTFAVDAAGAPIPADLVARLNRTRYFDLGMGDMRQLGLSNISLGLHEAAAPADIGGAVRDLDGKYALIRLPDFTHMQDSFGHLNGYSAIYYTYRWSKVIADDMFTQFEAHGLRDRATALRYRQLVLAPGGTKPAAELVADFLGRPISLDAYKAQLAKDL